MPKITDKLVLEALNEMLDADSACAADRGDSREAQPKTLDESLEQKMAALGFVCCGFCSEKAKKAYGIRYVWHQASAEACVAVGFGGEGGVN